MTIRFYCSTIMSYDAVTDQYVRCGCVLEASESSIGALIECGNCRKRVQVPLVSDSSLATPGERSKVAQTMPRSKTIASSLPSESVSTLSYSTFAHRLHCKQCGGPIDSNNKCLNCGFPAVMQVNATPLERFDVKPAGFQKWFGNIFTYGESPAAAVNGLHALVGIVLLILVVMSLVSQGLGQVIIFALVLCALGVYLYLVFDTRRIARKPAAKLSLWQRAGWNAMLFLARSTNWRLFHGKDQYKILDLHPQELDPTNCWPYPTCPTITLLTWTEYRLATTL